MENKRFNEQLRELGNKNKVAFKELYEEYAAKVYIVALNVTHDNFYAEDIVNEIFLDLWNNSSKYHDIENPGGWIYKVTKNTAIDFYGKHIKKYRKEFSLDDPNKIIKLPEHNPYEKSEFISYLTGLTDLERHIITMKILFKFTFQEIADELQISIWTIISKYARAIKKLEKQDKKENIN